MSGIRASLIAVCVAVVAVVSVLAAPLQDDYLVFFASGQSAISAQQDLTVQRAAQDITNAYAGGYTGPVNVDGHADAVEENVGVSLARAEAARDRLVQLGVPAGRIVIAAYGDMRLLVKTQPVVAVAQNRRAEISFGRAPRR